MKGSQPRYINPIRPLLLLLAATLTLAAQGASVAQLLAKDRSEFPGKEATRITVTYAPGQASAPHRHHAHVFVYVLEGGVVMQVAGGEPRQLGPGETFYEWPSDIHVVSKNASDTKPAKILVLMFKDKGKPASEPVVRK